MTALAIPGSAPELADAALAALLITAGHDGAWHRDWTASRTAEQARRLCGTGARFGENVLRGRSAQYQFRWIA